MKLIIEIDMSNADFSPDPVPEVTRILEELAYKITTIGVPAAGFETAILDQNGNSVGSIKMGGK